MVKSFSALFLLFLLAACSHFDGYAEHDTRPRYDITKLVYYEDDGFPIQLTDNLAEPSGKKWNYDWDRFQLALDRSYFLRAYTTRLEAFCGNKDMSSVTRKVREALPEAVADSVTDDDVWWRLSRSYHPYHLPSIYVVHKLARYAEEDPDVESEERIKDVNRSLMFNGLDEYIVYYRQGNPRYCNAYRENSEAFLYFVKAMYKIYFPKDRLKKIKQLRGNDYVDVSGRKNTREYYIKEHLPVNNRQLSLYERAWAHIWVRSLDSSQKRSDSLGQALLDAFDVGVCQTKCSAVGDLMDVWLTEY